MRFGHDSQAAPSRYWWAMSIVLRLDPAVRVSPKVRDMLPPDEPTETEEFVEVVMDTFTFRDSTEKPTSEATTPPIHRLILRRRVHGDAEDPANELPLDLVEELWGPGVPTEMREQLAFLSRSTNLHSALNYSRSALSLPGVAAIDLRYYMRDSDPPESDCAHVVRIVRNQEDRLELQIESSPLLRYNAADALIEMGVALGWTHYGWAFPHPEDADQELPVLGPPRVHCREFLDHYIERSHLVALGDLYLALAENPARLSDALRKQGWPLTMAMELSVRAACFRAFYPSWAYRPGHGEAPQEVVPYLKGREAFWRAAGVDAIPYLRGRFDDDCCREVVEIAPLADAKLCVSLFRWILSRKQVHFVVLESISCYGLLPLAPDLRDLIERCAYGQLTLPFGFPGMAPHKASALLIRHVFLTLRDLLSSDEFAGLALSAYFPPSDDQAGNLTFSRPILQAGGHALRDYSAAVVKRYRPGEETFSSASSRSRAEEFTQDVHHSLMSAIDNGSILAKILACNKLSTSMRKSVERRIEELRE